MIPYNKNQLDSLFLKFIWYRTLHISDRFTAHHQESSTVHTAIGTYVVVTQFMLADC